MLPRVPGSISPRSPPYWRPGFFPAVVPAALGDINFAANDGLNVAFAGFMEKIGGGKQVAVVGDGHGRHFQTRGFVQKLGNLASAVQQAVVRVQVQVNKLRIAHGTRL